MNELIDHLTCTDPLNTLRCLVDDDCLDICLELHEFTLIAASCAEDPMVPDAICVCGYHCDS